MTRDRGEKRRLLNRGELASGRKSKGCSWMWWAGRGEYVRAKRGCEELHN